jgi:hypothetical protein
LEVVIALQGDPVRFWIEVEHNEGLVFGALDSAEVFTKVHEIHTTEPFRLHQQSPFNQHAFFLFRGWLLTTVEPYLVELLGRH